MMLTIIDNCQEFHTLPRAGGILDQDALFMYINNEVAQARGVRAELDSKKAAKAK